MILDEKSVRKDHTSWPSRICIKHGGSMIDDSPQNYANIFGDSETCWTKSTVM